MMDGKKYLIRELFESDISQVISCINSVAEERIYIANEGIKEKKDTNSFKDFLLDQVRSGNWIFIVAEIGGRIVGHSNLQIGGLSKSKHTAYIATLLIKEYRDLGIGTALMRLAEEKAREKGVKKLYLSVFSSNSAAINFYKKCGFGIEGTLKDQFMIDGKYVDEVYMAKWL